MFTIQTSYMCAIRKYLNIGTHKFITRNSQAVKIIYFYYTSSPPVLPCLAGLVLVGLIDTHP